MNRISYLAMAMAMVTVLFFGAVGCAVLRGGPSDEELIRSVLMDMGAAIEAGDCAA